MKAVFLRQFWVNQRDLIWIECAQDHAYSQGVLRGIYWGVYDLFKIRGRKVVPVTALWTSNHINQHIRNFGARYV